MSISDAADTKYDRLFQEHKLSLGAIKDFIETQGVHLTSAPIGRVLALFQG